MVFGMTTLKTWIDDAWRRHGDAPEAVARELPARVTELRNDDEVAEFARLAHHVHGEHLGSWRDGLALLAAVERHAVHVGILTPEATTPADPSRSELPESQASLRRFVASLSLGLGDGTPRDSLPPAERIRATALAAASLAPFDTGRAHQLLSEAEHAIEDAGLPPTHPAQRTLAIVGNGVAITMEELPTRDAPQRALMLAAAEVARRYWERAGTWLQVERAEYRLAHSWLKAAVAGAGDAHEAAGAGRGDAERARSHAEACLRIVAEHGDVPLELFFGLEPLVLAERALGHADAVAAALARMRSAFGQLPAEDQRWCRASLEKLGGSAP